MYTDKKKPAPKKPAAKLKPLGKLKNSAKGPIHHIEIYPAKNSDGSPGVTTKVHRSHPPEVEKEMAESGRFMPDPKPDETIHEDGQDMLGHVARSYGIKQEPDGDEADDEGDGEE